MKYSWKAKSDDGAFEDNGKCFATKEDAYNDMRNHALEKMKWNTEWCDFHQIECISHRLFLILNNRCLDID